MSKVVVDYVDNDRGNCCELGERATVTRVVFARSDRSWAAVTFARTVDGEPDGPDYVVLHKTASTWQVIGFGHGPIGCLTPARVRPELAAGLRADAMKC